MLMSASPVRGRRGFDPACTISLIHSRARGADDGGRRRRDASYGVARDSHPVSTTAVRGLPRSPSLSPTRAREALMMAGAGGAMRATGWRATAIRFQQFGEGGPRVPYLSPTRAREALMMAGAGGAMRATGWRATAIRFQQFGEGGPRVPYLSPTRAREVTADCAHHPRTTRMSLGGGECRVGRTAAPWDHHRRGGAKSSAIDRHQQTIDVGRQPPSIATHSAAQAAGAGRAPRRSISYARRCPRARRPLSERCHQSPPHRIVETGWLSRATP